ncbi:hypothetical protein ACLBXO_22760 [Methylobacterium sp. C33D]|uniref:hypothetical protein n=1 Tax=Methylobacterium mesophilicum TaxID=39956 RepID=UPI002F352458
MMFSLDRRSPAADAADATCIVGRAPEGVRAFDRPDVIEAFAMFVREGSWPVWQATEHVTTLLHPGPQISSPSSSPSSSP